jgi:FkbM family methyltransferase
VPPSAELVPLLDRPLVALDVGCRWGIADEWDALLPDALRVFAFDADPEECRRLQASAPAGVTYVPHGLSDADGTATLHVAAQPACSSLFPPAPGVNGRSPALREDMREVGQEQVPMRTMDGWATEAGVDRADVLKLDVQGAELLVLRGGAELLRTVRLVELEVVFNPLYTGQALFGDVDAFLRGHGFELWRLGQLVHYAADWQDGPQARSDLQVYDGRPTYFPIEGGQLSWGHAFYCAPEYLDGSWATPAEAARDALAARLLGLPDLAAHASAAAGVAVREDPDAGSSAPGPPSAAGTGGAVAPEGEGTDAAPAPASPAPDRTAELDAELGRVLADRDELHAELARVRDDRDRLHATLAAGGTAASGLRGRLTRALRRRGR